LIGRIGRDETLVGQQILELKLFEDLILVFYRYGRNCREDPIRDKITDRKSARRLLIDVMKSETTARSNSGETRKKTIKSETPSLLEQSLCSPCDLLSPTLSDA